jgi:hypothetical protein
MQFLAELLSGKTGAASMTVMSRMRSSMNDPGENRSYAKLQNHTPIQPMSIDEFAEIQRALGEKIVKTGAVYWRRVRPFFFRPLLPYKAYEEDEIVAPCRYPGGFQYVVASQEKANSTMNFLMLDQVHEYSLDKLKHERRRLIKKASRQFEIRPLGDIKEFREQGYQAYLSFYKRTGYFYKANRIQKEKFGEWSDTIIKFPKAILLGGYGESGLVAVSISYLVDQTLIYATFFSDTVALQKGVGELMFHKIREVAAQHPDIREVFVRQYHGGNNQDKYYILRGCKFVRKPANLNLIFPAHMVLRSCFPKQYATLRGRD